ncbi:hypothetical protein HELRODRAFT_158457 [Helobdella robusta]|uniref:Kinesin motor domain-containing protein n=1 Tax=Helobdella robusta TaxID=6412 RepID=T1EMT4_HELRO|nr:hypothetical protein HELRODRAFT_158457 [Helobdella robusta]ESO12049.1 hypothetical protein HELRODRAFT_158457 [Helobdella robusta]
MLKRSNSEACLSKQLRCNLQQYCLHQLIGHNNRPGHDPANDTPPVSHLAPNFYGEKTRCEDGCEHYNELMLVKKQLSILQNLLKRKEQKIPNPCISFLEKNASIKESIIDLKTSMFVFLNDYKSFHQWVVMQLKQAESKLIEYQKYHKSTGPSQIVSAKKTPTQPLFKQNLNSRVLTTPKKIQQVKPNSLLNNLPQQQQQQQQQQQINIRNEVECDVKEASKVECSVSSSSEKNYESGSEGINIIDLVNKTEIAPVKSANLKGNKTICRICPSICDGTSVVSIEQTNRIKIIHNNRTKMFDVDHAYPASSSNDEVFENLTSTLKSCFDGVNVNIFAYGEAGSGKTFTIEGSTISDGLLMKTVVYLLDHLNNQFTLHYSLVELKNDIFRDIQHEDLKSCKLEAKQNNDGGLSLINLTKIPIASLEEMKKALRKGQIFKKNFPTTVSHFIHILYISANSDERKSITTKLHIVDLADSEKIEKNPKDLNRFKEYQNVNKTLSCLGDVLHALNSKQSHIPFRSSKLTHILQDSFSCDSVHVLIMHIIAGEQHSSETLSTLMFGQRTKLNEMNPQIMRSPNGKMSKSDAHNNTLTPSRPRRPSVGLNEVKLTSRKPSITSDLKLSDF